MKKWILSLCSFLSITLLMQAQIQEPVQWQTSVKKITDQEIAVVFKASIDAGWHVYGVDIPEDGPTPATVTLETLKKAELKGKLVPITKPKRKYDPLFQMKVSFFEKEAILEQHFKVEGEAYQLEGYLEYGACDETNCLPPTKVSFSYQGKKAVAAVEKTETPKASPLQTMQWGENDGQFSALWKPVVSELRAYDASSSPEDHTWLYILLTGFIGGLLALFTPCVWPIIPMTVSFFLKRTKDKKKGVRDAWLYGLSIVVIYLVLGLSVTFLFGASALNALSTNAIFNILFFLMLVIFAASFFGAFELQLPASWSTSIDAKAEKKGGMLGIFLMAFTLTLVSFSCTGPIIGFLLVEVASTGNFVGPAIGMFGFALALALPFTLFALFPSWLKSMPKSGGWMNVVKVVLGFIELAFALKFLSVADLAYGWHILDRETFLALWIVLFALLGFYLLGKIRFPHDDEVEHVSVPRFFMALITLAFAVYMVPGLWGAPLKAVSAFAPPMQTQDFNLYEKDVHAQFDDYDLGMAYAKQQRKPVMLDFTGYGCVNCRKMELSVWTDDKVRSLLTEDYVLITLYVDNKEKLSTPIEVVENGKTLKLTTVGDKWSYLQRSKFGANAQPFYVLVDAEGTPLNHAYTFDEDVTRYIDFLQQGLENYKK